MFFPISILSFSRGIPDLAVSTSDGNNGDELWRVEYDDGDVEDLNRSELDAATVEAERLALADVEKKAVTSAST